MANIADVRNEVTRVLSLAPEPLYAVAGAGDLAVEKLRDAQDRLRRVQLDQLLADLPDEARHLPERLEAARADVSQRVRDLPSGVVAAAADASDRATSVYDDLAARGRRVVERLAGPLDGGPAAGGVWPTARPPEPRTTAQPPEPKAPARPPEVTPTAEAGDTAVQPTTPEAKPAAKRTSRTSGSSPRESGSAGNGSPGKRTS